MMSFHILIGGIGLALAACGALMPASSAAAPAVIAAPSQPCVRAEFLVEIGKSLPGPVSGRILIFMKQGKGDAEVDVDEAHPSAASVAALEISNVAPGAIIEVNVDALAYPAGFSSLQPGDYEAQAVLDVDHTYNQRGRAPQDWISDVIRLEHWMPGNGPWPVLELHLHPTESDQAIGKRVAMMARVKPGEVEDAEFSSTLLTRFWGRDTKLQAWVVLPPAYAEHPHEKYPTVYWAHGFGSNGYGVPKWATLNSALRMKELMDAGKIPPMIWVMLNQAIPQGTHEFADSVNNGPWGSALTAEFIPFLESHYRMDARPSGRFLNGHSSGGWATLQLQINYPHMFGATWSTAPDPGDFHDFTGIDLYANNANMYRSPAGNSYPIMRDHGKAIATLKQFAQVEEVLGPDGGQMSSFEWVFSPKSDTGAPQPMFDRKTGAVNPQVIAYWQEHYDLAHLVESRLPKSRFELKDRIHVIVGTADTFFLDGSARQFESRLRQLGIKAHFTYVPDKTHFDLYAVGEDKYALYSSITAEMYANARPGASWK